jgi:hypothetical protein
MVLAPTLTLSAGSGAAIVRPTFSRDFAGEKTLNNGTGPAIAFTRASNATYFDASGTLQTASSDTPRFDHDPATGASRGLLIEEARTNSIRNSQAGGVSAGTLPTNWTATGTTNNVTRTIVGGGTEDGLSYLEIQYSGTPSATASVTIAFDSSSQVVAANGQTWTGSAYCKLQAGSLTNVGGFRIGTDGRDAAGAALSPAQRTTTNIAPTSSPLRQHRVSAAHTMADAAVERAWTFIIFSYASGDPIDLTLRIAAPQLEQGAFPTSYIPTTSAAATRAADSAVVTPISSFYNASEGTLVAEVSYAGAASDTNIGNRVSLQIDDNTTDNRHLISNRQTNGTGGSSTVVSGTNVAPLEVGSTAVPVNTPVRLAMAYATNDIIAAKNGSLSSPDTNAALPSVTHLRAGHATTTASRLNGHIRKIAYWPKRLTNTLLEQLTT